LSIISWLNDVAGIVTAATSLTHRRGWRHCGECNRCCRTVIDNIRRCIFWKDRNCVYLLVATLHNVDDPENIVGKQITCEERRANFSLESDQSSHGTVQISIRPAPGDGQRSPDRDEQEVPLVGKYLSAS